MGSRCSDAGRPKGLRYACTPLIVVAAAVACTSVAQAFRPASAQAPSSETAKQVDALSRRAAQRLASLQREAESLAKQERTLLNELRALEVQREIKVEERAVVDRDAAAVQAKLADATKRAEALQQNVERQRPDVEQRLVQLYKMGRAGYWRGVLDVNTPRERARAG